MQRLCLVEVLLPAEKSIIHTCFRNLLIMDTMDMLDWNT